MYLSDKHLQEFVAHGKSPKELARLLTEKVVEVEAVHRWELDHVVVGEVKKIKAHPNADRLRLVETSVGNRTLTIVCGGKNLYEGEKVAVALEGASVRWHGEGEKVKLGPATIRGVKSEGMICAAGELELPIADREPSPQPSPRGRGGDDGNPLHAGEGKGEGPCILDLTRFIPKAKPGTPLAKALGLDDVRYEIDNKSLARRADLWGYWGMSREIAATTGSKMKNLEYATVRYSKPGIAIVRDRQGCLRYIAARIDNVKVVESPWEVQRTLIQAGLRPINLIVDLTNLVMIELGQPMHAFDATPLYSPLHKGGKRGDIIIRKARAGERLKALNGTEYALTPQDCVIANENSPIALAGIIGGEHSGIQHDTTSIILESATFEPVMIRKTSQRLLLRTDSSARFEKGQPVEMADLGLRRFLWLLEQYQPGATLQYAESIGQTKTVNKKVVVDGAWLDRLVGPGVIPIAKVTSILKGLGCAVTISTVNGQQSKVQLTVVPPYWRNDIEIPEDVAEEVARLYGFNAIGHALPVLPAIPPYQDPRRTLVESVRTFFVERCAFTETESYPFAVKVLPEDKRHLLNVVSPISQESSHLRDSLIPNVLEGVGKNLRFSDEVQLFEIGRVFDSGHASEYRITPSSKITLPAQPLMCVGAISSKGKSEEELFRLVKGHIDAYCVFANYHLRTPVVQKSEDPKIAIEISGKTVGIVRFALSKEKARHNVEQATVVFELNLDMLAGCPADRNDGRYVPLPKFPSIRRDLSIIVDSSMPHQTVKSTILNSGVEKLFSAELFDVFTKRLPEGKKSLAFHLTFSDSTRTLTNQEVDVSMEKLLNTLERELDAIARQ